MNHKITFFLSVFFLLVSFSCALIAVLSGTVAFPATRVDLLLAAIVLSSVGVYACCLVLWEQANEQRAKRNHERQARAYFHKQPTA